MAKTTMRVRKKQWDLFTRECKAASLRRDDLFDRVLPDELALLSKIPPCDEIGRGWLKANWTTIWSLSDIEFVPAPVRLSEAVINQLNSGCTEKGVPRDAFIDCALAYLTRRLYGSVVVIKQPRSSYDLEVQMIKTYLQSENEADLARWTKEDIEESLGSRDLSPFEDDFYQKRLSYTADRVGIERLFLEDSRAERDGPSEAAKPTKARRVNAQSKR